MVLFSAVPVLTRGVGRRSQQGTVPDSVDGGDSDLGVGNGDATDGVADLDPACGRGSRAGGCVCSCEEELGHLNGKVWKLEDLVRLLVASAGLAGWEETWRVENLRRKRKVQREEGKRDHARRVAAERAAGEERKRLAKREEQAKRAEEVRKSQEESAHLLSEQGAAAEAALEVSVEECVKATTTEELVPRAAKVAEAAESVKRVKAIPSPASEDVDVGGGWRVLVGNVVRKVEIVSRLRGPVGRARTAGLPKLVEEVQTLLQGESSG